VVVTLVGLFLGRNPNTTEDEEYRLVLDGSGTHHEDAGLAVKG
jgi:hypothetical protein